VATDAYERRVNQQHRPSHARRTARSHAAFLLPLLQPGHRVLDIGCGPGSITAGLHEAVGPDGVAIGLDRRPGPGPVPFACGDLHRLPFPDTSFDAVFLCAVLQHVPDPLAALVEARRVCRPGAVIGVADADWGGELVTPEDAWIERGTEILEQLRAGTDPRVGRQLRGLLHRAGFAEAVATASGRGGGGPGTVAFAEFQASLFEPPEVIQRVTGQGIASAADMKAVAAAWRRWGAEPGATIARHWFEATARVPSGDGPD
jgi:SAM-dependent methyltransferase